MQHFILIYLGLQFLQRNIGKVSNTIIHITNGNEIFFFLKKTIKFLSTSIELQKRHGKCNMVVLLKCITTG